MRHMTRLGIILLVIGLSFLTGTVYRSFSPDSFSYGDMNFLPLNPHSWNNNNQTIKWTPNFWAPRDLRMEVATNASVDVYILDAEGMRLWNHDGTLNPIWAFKNVTQQIFTLQIPVRGEYAFLLYNPTDSSVGYEIHSTLHGYEKDLLWTSITFILTGFIITVTSFLIPWKAQKLFVHTIN